MRKTYLSLFFIISIVSTASAQEKKPTGNGGQSNAISVALDVPIGDFSKTQTPGFGADYSWTNHRFGRLTAVPAKPIGFIVNAGADYYIGKKESVFGPVLTKDPSFTSIHLYGGIIYNAGNNINIHLLAGPGLGLHNKNTEFWPGANLGISFFVSDHFAFTPTFHFLKHSDADPLTAVSLRGTFSF